MPLFGRCSSRLILCAAALASCASLTTPSFGAPNSTAGVYVRDSGVAVENFALADRLEHLGEWSKAADVYQELATRQGDRVIATSTDATRFQSVVEAVQQRLCKWSPEALTAYRDRYGPEAQTLLDHAMAEHRDDQRDDIVALDRVYSLYFVTEAGKTAGMRLMDAALENADFVTAITIGERLLHQHPMLAANQPGADRPMALYRTALAENFAGQDTEANAKLAELKQTFPQALGTVRGVDVVLADSLASELNHTLTPPTTSHSESWPMPFGSADRSRTPNVSGLAGARLFSVPLEMPAMHAIPGSITSIKAQLERPRKFGLTLGIVPVVDRGELFFQDNAHVYAVSLESGLPLPGWQESYPGEGNGHYSINAWPSPRSQLTTTCVTDDAVLAVMGFEDLSTVAMQGRMIRNPQLVCLDRRTGRERWVFDQDHLPAEPAALRQLKIGGTPLVVGDNIYLAASGGQGMQFLDSYVICLDRASGNYKWSTYVASANDTAAMWDPEGAGGTPSITAQLAYSGGRLFVATNVGAVASLDGLDGTIVWLDLYPREAMPDPRLWSRGAPNGQSNGKRPWTINPVIVDGGKVFACPSDGSALLVYDATDGKALQHIGLTYRTSSDANASPETADTLIGISDTAAGPGHGRAAILASDRSVFCVQVDDYDPAKLDENLLWINSSLVQVEEDPIRGRAFLTHDSVIVPLIWGLASISLHSGSVQTKFPPSGAWNATDDGPGNVLLTSDHLIIAGAQHVNVYTDLGIATARLDHAIEQNPNDPEVRLRYAEVMLAARRFDGPKGALAKLDEAEMLLTAQSNGGRTSTLWSRLFNDALNFAVAADASAKAPDKAANKPETADRSVVEALFDIAAKAATTPAEQVTYRFRRADHLKHANDPAAELSLYQQVLLEPNYRPVTVSDPEHGFEPASGYAYQAINDVTQRAGVSIYKQYEDAAGKLFADAQQLSDPAKQRDQFLALSESYPNSAAAREAMLAAAQNDETLGEPRAAAGLLRKFSIRYANDDSQNGDRATVLESLARLYLEMPDRSDRLSVAIGRLEQVARLPTPATGPRKLQQALKLPDGSTLQNVTFQDAAAAVRKFQAIANVNQLADFHVQSSGHPNAKPATLLPEVPEAALADVAELIEPLDDFNRHDRIVTYTSNHDLNVYAIGKNQPQWSSSIFGEVPDHVAWINGNLLVWCSSRLTLLRGEAAANDAAHPAGSTLWDAPLQSLPSAQFASVSTSADDAAVNLDGDADVNGNRDEPDQIPPVMPGQNLQGWRIARNGQLIRVIRPGVLQVGKPIAQPATEQIDHLVAGTERIVFSTSGSGGAANPDNGNAPDAGGRIVSINLADGHVEWQTRLANRSIDQLVVNDDFVAVRASSDNEVRLIAFDAQSGQVLWRPKAFGRENNDLGTPINLALAQDGSLVYVIANGIYCKDLFDPDPKLRFEPHAAAPNNASPFAGATAPDQLIVRDGRVIVVSDGGMFVRIYSLADGKPYDRGDGNESLLSTGGSVNSGAAHLRLVGTDLYVFGQDHVKHYGLTNGKDYWTSSTIDKTDLAGNMSGSSAVVRDIEITPTEVVALLVPPDLQLNNGAHVLINGVAIAPQPDTRTSVNTVSLRPFSRLKFHGIESGSVMSFDQTITDTNGITDVQIVDGGVYYSTGDHQVHFLRASPHN